MMPRSSVLNGSLCCVNLPRRRLVSSGELPVEDANRCAAIERCAGSLRDLPCKKSSSRYYADMRHSLPCVSNALLDHMGNSRPVLVRS